LARSRNEVTDIGKLLDPLADKILISSAFITFVGLKEVSIPPWLVIIIISREFAITGLRLVAAGKGKIIPAGRWGKHKTLSQVVTVSAVLIYLCLYYDKRMDITVYRPLILTLISLTAAFTISSGGYYMIKNMSILLNGEGRDH
jgi:CDP-diacylglycerol--glycerol-3-phosphate 3-phosphatidyltransferase